MTPAETDVEAVTATNQQLYAAVENADLDLIAALWLDGNEASMAVCVHPGWPLIQGREEILRSWAAIMANTPYIQFFLTDVQVQVDGDIAVVTCVENILTDVGENALTGGHVVATNIYRRRSDSWQLWIHHASPVLGQYDPHDDE